MKNVCVRDFSAQYSDRMWENAEQKSFEYGHFLRSRAFKFHYFLQHNHWTFDFCTFLWNSCLKVLEQKYTKNKDQN